MNIPWKLKSRAIHLGCSWHESVVRTTGARTLIEFGAGKTLVQNLYLSQYLTQQTVVDLFPMLELPMLNQAIEQLCALGVAIDGRPVADLEAIYGIRYRAPFDMRDRACRPAASTSARRPIRSNTSRGRISWTSFANCTGFLPRAARSRR